MKQDNALTTMTQQQVLYQNLQEQFPPTADVYARMNRLRNWVNANLPEFELYLEDVWNEHVEGETWFEYILRSRKTLNETRVLAYDVYKNHQDAKGVWHLDEYVESVCLMDDVAELVAFILANGGDSFQ